MNEEQPNPEQGVVETARNDAQPQPPEDPQRRLRQLLAIPDRDRSDELWDELNALEIQLASVNRSSAPQQTNNNHRQGQGQSHDPGRESWRRTNQARQQKQPPGGGGGGTNKPSKRFFNRPKRGAPK